MLKEEYYTLKAENLASIATLRSRLGHATQSLEHYVTNPAGGPDPQFWSKQLWSQLWPISERERQTERGEGERHERKTREKETRGRHWAHVFAHGTGCGRFQQIQHSPRRCGLPPLLFALPQELIESELDASIIASSGTPGAAALDTHASMATSTKRRVTQALGLAKQLTDLRVSAFVGCSWCCCS